MEGMIRRTTLPIVSVLAALAAVLAFASAAQADRDLRGVHMAGKPATAEEVAATGRCTRGEFCGWRHVDYTGGLFHYDGDDTNLFNDRFENADTNVIVAKQISSVYNNGYDGAFDDVLATTTRGNWCIRNGYLENNIGKWSDTVTGYRWTNCDGG